MEIVIVLCYFALIFGVGYYFKGKINNTDDYYLGGRSLSWPIIMLTTACTFMGASSTMAKTGLGYRAGLSAVTLTFASCFGMFVMSMIAPRIRAVGAKYKVSSIPGLFYLRFGRTAAIIAGIIIIWTLVGTIGGQVVATSTILKTICAPWGVSYELAAVLSLVIVVAYSLLSGMYGVVYTDAVQGIIVFLALGIVLPLATVGRAGGPGQMMATLPASFWSYKPSLNIIGMMWVYLLYFAAGPPYWQRAFASSSAKGARKGNLLAIIIILLYTYAITITGMAGVIVYPQMKEVGAAASESILPLMVRDLFHPVFAGLVMAAILAILMSTIDSYLINAAQTFVSDLYKFINPHITEAQQLKYAKYAIFGLGCASVVFAFNIRVILDAILFAMSFFAAALCLPALAALYWKKATRQGIVSAMLVGVFASIIWQKVLHTPFGLHQTIPAGIACLIVLLGVSLLTYNEKNCGKFCVVDKNELEDKPGVTA